MKEPPPPGLVSGGREISSSTTWEISYSTLVDSLYQFSHETELPASLLRNNKVKTNKDNLYGSQFKPP